MFLAAITTTSALAASSATRILACREAGTVGSIVAPTATRPAIRQGRDRSTSARPAAIAPRLVEPVALIPACIANRPNIGASRDRVPKVAEMYFTGTRFTGIAGQTAAMAGHAIPKILVDVLIIPSESSV